MSESVLSVLIIFAEIGAVLLTVMIGWVILLLLRLKKEGRTTRELIEYIKTQIPQHREQLKTYFNDEMHLEQNKTDFNVDTLIKDEQNIYTKLVDLSVNKNTEMLKATTEDIGSLIDDYVRLLAMKGETVESEDERKSKELALRKENEALRIEVTSLQKRLDASTLTIENMLSEFSSMYEGGKKEGEKLVKNEMYKLKQSMDQEKARVAQELSDLDKEEQEAEAKE